MIKDVARNQDTARRLGIYSPTPSSHALQVLLGVAGCLDLVLGAADVTAAFMATPQRERDVIAKLPLPVSDLSGR